eukprot:scaffold329634_cov79-Tisochrysis_lutea.AAC.1
MYPRVSRELFLSFHTARLSTSPPGIALPGVGRLASFGGRSFRTSQGALSSSAQPLHTFIEAHDIFIIDE